MASIQTGIQLQDNFTNVILGIINSVNLAVSAMDDMNSTMSSDIDTASIQAARDQINQANAAANRLNETLDGLTLQNVPAAPATPSWTNQSNMQIFNDTGISRLTNEMGALNEMSAEVFRSQQRIDRQALSMEILPQNASWDINATSQRISELAGQMNSLHGIDISGIGSDSAERISVQYEHLRANMNDIINLQASLEHAAESGNVSGLNEGYNRLNSLIEQAEVRTRAVQQTMNNFTGIQWHSDTMPSFTNTGIERFQQEIQSANSMMQQLGDTQNNIARQALNANVLPPTAVQDINSLTARIDSIRTRIQRIENNPINIGTSTANAELERLRGMLNQTLTAQNTLNTAMQSMDIGNINQSYLRLSQTIRNTEHYIRDNTDEQGRFNQEIQQGVENSNQLTSVIGSAISIYAMFQAGKAALDISDSLALTISRLNLMNDGIQSTNDLVNMVYLTAQDARGSFSDMADVVARFGNNARDAFSSSAEVVQFAGLVQKQMTIAGASTDEASNAMLQLSQALGSGVLRGDELNSIFEQAPNLIQNIADYLDVPIGKIREMAADGELSADTVKQAIFSASDEINENFEQMPQTFSQIWTSLQNTALMAMQPILNKINEVANSDAFEDLINHATDAISILAQNALPIIERIANSQALWNFANGIIDVLSFVGVAALKIFDLLAGTGDVIADNWSILSPIILGVAAALAVYYGWQMAANGISLVSKGIHMTMAIAQMMHAAATGGLTAATAGEIAAQNGLNSAMYACPITWIIMLIIALIAIFYAVIAVINKLAGTTISATGVICGAFATAGAFIANIFIGLINTIIGIGVELYNLIASFANFFANVFNDPVGAIMHLFADLFDFIAGIIQSAAKLIDTVLGSNLAGAVAGFRKDFAGAIDDLIGEQTVVLEKKNAEDYQFDRKSYSDAWDAGYSFGEGIEDKISNFGLDDMLGATDDPAAQDYSGLLNDNTDLAGQTAGNTGEAAKHAKRAADSLNISSEDLKYLRDIAETDYINRFTTAEITVNQTNHNNINKEIDLDGVTEHLRTFMEEQMASAAEGVH